MNEEEKIIIDKCLEGDTVAFRKLVDLYRNFAFTLAVRITKNEEDAEEVTQDAFLKAYIALKNF